MTSTNHTNTARSVVVLFHSAYGLRPAVHAFADQLRADGHVVHTPDLFDGAVFHELAPGVKYRDELGIPELMRRAQSSVAELPSDVVYAGFSMGTGPAEMLALTRPGARGAVLMHGALPLDAVGVDRWPASVALQVHYAERDPEVDAASVTSLARDAGAAAGVFRYPCAGHLFADDGLPDYNAESAAKMVERVRAFVRSVP